MTTPAKPAMRPARPEFSSGPCAKRPGWTPQNLQAAVLGRSHRSKLGKARLTDAIESTRPQWEPRLNALMKRGQFVLGEEVASFEREFAAAVNAGSTVGVASGTDAISLSLRAARIQGEVCTTALTAPFTGIAILCHPENFRAPQPMRLHPKEPFVCYAPSQLGDWAIEPGRPYVSRYRFVVKDGKLAA